MLRIGEFARLANVSIKLLRHYHDIGLLPAHATDRNTGYRYYSVTQLARFNRLLVYRSLGFSLKEIRRLALLETSPADLRAMLAERRARLAAQIEAERARLDEIEARIAQIDGEESRSAYEVMIRSVDASAAVSLRRTCESYDEVAELLQSLRSALPSRAGVTGYGAIWHRCHGKSDGIDCEALVFLDRTGNAACGKLKLIELPACTVASVLCDEAAQNSRVAYRAAIDRAVRLGYQVAGPMRECYAVDGARESGLTEAQFPLVLTPTTRRAPD